MKSKLIHADYNAENGISQVVIENRNGCFMGIAQCHEEEEAPSDYAGCRIAEARAHIKSAQFEKNILNWKIKELEDFEKILKSLKDYNPDCLEARRLRRRIHELKAERKAKIILIASMKDAVTKALDERDAYFAKKNSK